MGRTRGSSPVGTPQARECFRPGSVRGEGRLPSELSYIVGVGQPNFGQGRPDSFPHAGGSAGPGSALAPGRLASISESGRTDSIMCGIAGWIGRSERQPDQRVLRAMTDPIAHRGPDGEGHCEMSTRDGRHGIGLGHRRLAIIDLDTGQQPMSSHDGRVTIVFNGEIYNFQELRRRLSAQGHRFVTASDTEVVIEAYRAWGPESVTQLRGMFAFALWDADRERLVLARDP